MARKGTKFKTYSPELKKQIIKEYFDGQGGSRNLGHKYQIPYQTIKNWIEKAKCNLDFTVDNRGRNSKGKRKLKSKNLTLEDYKERYEILKKYQVFLQARREKK